MVAVLSAMMLTVAQAGMYTIGGVIGKNADGSSVNGSIEYSDIPVHSGAYAPLAKDGTGTLTLTGAGTINNSIYVREGELVIQAPTGTDVVISGTRDGLHYDSGGNLNGFVPLSVGGKDARMVIDGARLNVYSWGAALGVGGADGNGSLVLQNGAKLDNWNGFSFFIGYPSYEGLPADKIGFMNGHASTAETTGDYTDAADRYVGNYTEGVSGTGDTFGRGDVLVTSGSSLICGKIGGGLFMAEGTLTAEDSSYVYADSSIMGRKQGSTSYVKLTDESTLEIKGNVVTCAEENSAAHISADNSEIVIKSGLYMTPYDNVKAESTLSLTNGAVATIGNVVSVGSEDGSGVSKVDIDSTSSLLAKDDAGTVNLNVYHAQVNNAGTIEASTVNINDGGTVTVTDSAAVMDVQSVSVHQGGALAVASGVEASITSDVDVASGGAIELTDGGTLKVDGALTMAAGAVIRLSGAYQVGDEVLSSTSGDLDTDGVTLDFANGSVNYSIENGVIVITGIFNQGIADALTVTNWGIATASRTFVNAVRGQRTNTGCIANGRGTAWAAVLGATSDIGSGDVDLKGAAVGADMKVGEKSSLGVAFGYIDGDAKIPGMSKAEQEGTYVALYGEHGLRKLSATCCLSLDWVAAYGQTDTEWESADWEQQSLQLNTRLNWNKKVTDRLCMSVFGGLEYFTSESDRVENAKTGSIQNLRGEIGVGARYVAWGTPGSEAVTDEKGATIAAARPGCEKLVLHGEIRYMNDMVRSNPVIEQDGIRDGGDNPGRQGMGIEAGATYRISERWSASANYGFNTMEDSKEHRVNVGASYTF